MTGKYPVQYVYTFPVSGFARPIAANKSFVFSSLLGKNMFQSLVLADHFLLIWCSYLLIQMPKDSCF